MLIPLPQGLAALASRNSLFTFDDLSTLFRMPRFNDQWLIDRTLFDYVQGGSCACCSFNFLPTGTKGLIESMSEFETDAANAEVSALAALPWPPDMKDQVWMERVRLRQFCKKNMIKYREFWEQHNEGYEAWFLDLPTERLRRLFQLPRSEIVERLKTQEYHMHAAFGTVLCAVTEQVANFPLTAYPADGRGVSEVGFEDILTFDRRGGFTLKDIDSDNTKTVWLLRQKTLGGPKLLERNEKQASPGLNSDDEDSEDEQEATNATNYGGPPTPSFRSDRRIVRLLIARHFADVLERAYYQDQQQKEEEKAPHDLKACKPAVS